MVEAKLYKVSIGSLVEAKLYKIKIKPGRGEIV